MEEYKIQYVGKYVLKVTSNIDTSQVKSFIPFVLCASLEKKSTTSQITVELYMNILVATEICRNDVHENMALCALCW